MVNGAEERVRGALARVPDPEIPSCSIADLGMIADVRVTPGAVEVDLLPTFAGCPAQLAIREDAERAVAEEAPGLDVRVRFVYDPPWTTDRITPEGRRKLGGAGIAPPGPLQIGMRCPYCGSLDTHTESEFGPTPCRTIRYCRACRNPFEGFKVKRPA